MEKFPERLKQLRITKEFTEEDVATMLGISLHTYKKYEGGINSPYIDTFIAISKLFNVSSNYLAGLTDNPDSYKI